MHRTQSVELQKRMRRNTNRGFSIEFWVSFAANPKAEPRNSLGQVWPKYQGPSGLVMDFGIASAPGGPNPAYVAPVSVADFYSGPCL